MTYPIAGWVGEAFGLPVCMLTLGILAVLGSTMALFVWPSDDARELAHEHPDLPSDHPHLREYQVLGNHHRHAFVIDDEHRAWPTHG